MRTTIPLLAACLFAVSLTAVTGCHRMGPVNHGGGFGNGGAAVDVTFTPYSAVRSERATESAVRFYEGDKQLLSKAGAQYVGELELDAHENVSFPFNGKKKKKNIGDILSGRAASEAAKVGATHYLLVETGVDVNEYQVAPEQEETEQVQGYDQHGRKVTNSVTTKHEAKSIRTEAPRGRFALFRVDPNRWTELPAPLRPTMMAGDPTSTTAVTSAPMR
jgi:hypothetical protein